MSAMRREHSGPWEVCDNFPANDYKPPREKTVSKKSTGKGTCRKRVPTWKRWLPGRSAAVSKPVHPISRLQQ